MELLLWGLAFFLGAFAAQRVLLRLTRAGWKWLRVLPLGAAAWLWLHAWHEFHAPFLTGLSQLAAFAHAAAGVLVLLGCAAAWVMERRRR